MELASAGDLTDLAFYRAIQASHLLCEPIGAFFVAKGCIVQFGLPPKRSWSPLPDDPPTGMRFVGMMRAFLSPR